MDKLKQSALFYHCSTAASIIGESVNEWKENTYAH